MLLYDVRAYRQKSHFAANDPRCFEFIGSFKALPPAGLGTHLDRNTGQMVECPLDRIREAIPHIWRKAFDRASLWAPRKRPQPEIKPRWRDNLALAGTMTLRDTRGKTICTIWVVPYAFD